MYDALLGTIENRVNIVECQKEKKKINLCYKG